MNIIQEALLKTKNGRQFLMDVLTKKQQIYLRTVTFRDVLRTNLIEKVPGQYKIGLRQYNEAENKVRELSTKGGEAYEKALTACKMMWVTSATCSPNQSFMYAMELIKAPVCPPELKPIKKFFKGKKKRFSNNNQIKIKRAHA